MTKYNCFFKRNEFIRNLVLVLWKTRNFPNCKRIISFTIPGISIIFFRSFWNIVIKFYINIFLAIIIIFICRTLRLSIISIPFNILNFSSNNKLEKEKLNKKNQLFRKLLELQLLVGFLWKKLLRKLSLLFKLLTLICRSLFWLRFCKS